MAKLILGNVDDRLLETLKLRASLNDRSLDEELKFILRSSLERRADRESLRKIIQSMSQSQ